MSNGLNQYDSVAGASLSYDDSGNLTSDGVWNFVYDVENMLLNASKPGVSASYLYDPLGRRSAKTVDTILTTFLHDGVEEIADYNASGTLLRRYVHGPGVDEYLVMYTGSGTSNKSYFHANHQGSIVAMSDGSGNVTEQHRYDSYGNSDELTGNPFRYTGRRLDEETGLYYYRARYYSTKLGRFLQTDPIGYGDGLNWYAYVGNDPVNNNDPTGKFLNFVVQFAVNTAVNAAIQYAETGSVDITQAAVDGAIDTVNPVAALSKIAKVAKLMKTVGKVDKKSCCFVAGTQVLTKNGLRNIENIAVGDIVLSRDTETGIQDWKPVIELIRRHDREIWQLELSNAKGEKEQFRTTDDHPWWVKDQGWKRTDELMNGMSVETDNGSVVNVKSVVNTKATEKTYNIEVADFHTYFVGKNHLLVHNACGPKSLKNSTPVGAKVKTPDNSEGAFKKLKGGQGFKDKKTGTIMKKSNTNHSNSSGGEFKAGTKPGKPPTKSEKVTISGGKEGGCVLKKDGC